tara:strand:+ start:20 stop:1198 length:1179 start_codon:yes stop_codon:yes gene_type:complete
MAYIGKNPTAVPLTSSDITDGIITTAKIADANVTNPKLTSGSQQNFRNIIINGDMSIAQRGTSGTLQNGTGGYLCLDRWNEIEGGSESFVFTVSQDSDVPTGQGFAKSLKFDCTTADASLAADGALTFRQKIEGQNIQYLKKGTSNAVSTTLSFWVKSVKTGTYIIALVDVDNSRSISKSYTIDSASTWEYKTITYAGDTSGAFGNDNGNSLQVEFYLGAGSNYTSGTLQTSWGSNVATNQRVGQVNLADSTSNNFWITGVQLEAGTTASDFEFLPVDVNLQRCLRYYELLGSGYNYTLFNAFNYTSTALYSVASTQVVMRTNPSVDQTTGTSYYRFIRDNGNDYFDSLSVDIAKTNSIELLNSSEISGTAGQTGWVRLNHASSYLALDSEL